jgi:hypothetical protein
VLTKNIKKQQKTSKNIKKQQKTSKNIKKHQKTLKNIKKHQNNFITFQYLEMVFLFFSIDFFNFFISRYQTIKIFIFIKKLAAY